MSNDTERRAEKSLPRVRPATDIIEREDGFYIYMDIPGVKRDDLVLDLKENELTVQGVAQYSHGDDEKFVEVEFGSGEYSRSFTLADFVDRDKIKASLDNGVLEIHLPKVEKSSPRRIVITQG